MDSTLDPLTAKVGERSNWDVLALLRFFLALVVAIFHLNMLVDVGPARCLILLGPLEAVLGFLLISGYSIGHSITKEADGFLGRRLWRIYPIYLAAMLLTYLAQPEPLTASFAWMITINLLFLSEILIKVSYIGQAWSLSLEVWLYCLAPFLVRLRAASLELLIVLSFLCFVIYTCGRTLFHWPYYVQTLYGINLPTLAFIWLAGFYLAVSATKERALRLIGLLLCGYMVLALAIQGLYRLKHGELPLFLSKDMIGYAGNSLLFLLLYIVFRGVVRHQFHLSLFERRVCRFLGDISYPFYLVHTAVYIFLVRYCQNAVLLLLAALLTSSVVYFCCDFYSRRRKVT